MPLGDIAIWRARISDLSQFSLKRSSVKSKSCYKSPLSDLLLNTPFFLFILILFGDFLIYSALLLCIHDMNWSFIFHSFKYFLSKKGLRLLSVNLYIIKLIQLSILLLSHDIEINPGPQLFGNLSICFWILNNIMSDNFQNVSSIIEYNAIHKYDLIYSGETYLNSRIISDNHDSIIDG